ncbi:MAG: WD40 repeat domain-containing protein [Streptosporangiaceae bacterium]
MSDWRVAWTAWKGSAHKKLTGHTEDITSVAIGQVADRDVIVSAGGGTVCLWDPFTGEPIGSPLGTAAGAVSAMALGRVGGRDVIACACGRPGYQEVRVWDAATRQLIGALPGQGGYVDAMVLGQAGGRDVLACTDRTRHEVRIWDAVTGHQVAPPVPIPAGWHSALTLARDGRRDVIAVAVGQSSIYDPRTQSSQAGHVTMALLDPGKGKLIGRSRQLDGVDLQSMLAMTYEPAGDQALCAGEMNDRKVRIWDPRTGRAIGRPLDAPGAQALAFGRVAERLVLVSSHYNEATRFWDVLTGEQVRAPVTHDQSPQVLAVGRAGDRDLIVCAAGDGVVTWDAVTREAVSRLPFVKPDQPRALALALAPSAPGLHLLCASALDTEVIVHEWDAATWRLVSAIGLPVIVSHPTLTFGWLLDRLWIVFVDQRDRNIHIRDAFAGSVVGPAFTRPAGDIYALAAGRAAGREVVIAGGSDGTVTILDAASGAPIGEPLAAHEGPVWAVALTHANGSDYITSGGNDRRIICWSASLPA